MWRQEIYLLLILSILYGLPQSSSLQVCARLYEHGGFTGSYFELYIDQPVSNLVSTGWNDRISSVRIIGEGIVVEAFEHTHFGGQRLGITSTSDYNAIRNDWISSLKCAAYESLDGGPGCLDKSITSASECVEAAASLGYKGTLEEIYLYWAPPGCHVGTPHDNWSYLYFNTYTKGRIGRSRYRSICHPGAKALKYVTYDDGPGCYEDSIATASECATAAASLGYSGKLENIYLHWAPPGCHVGAPEDRWSYLYFNTFSGQTGRSRYRSICYSGLYVAYDNGPGCLKPSISSPSECGVAAAFLNYGGNVQVDSWSYRPPGCSVGWSNNAWSNIYFNKDANGIKGKSEYRSLCPEDVSSICCFIIQTKSQGTWILTDHIYRDANFNLNTCSGSQCAYSPYENSPILDKTKQKCLSDLQQDYTCCSEANGALCKVYSGTGSKNNIRSGICSGECKNIADCKTSPSKKWCKSKKMFDESKVESGNYIPEELYEEFLTPSARQSLSWSELKKWCTTLRPCKKFTTTQGIVTLEYLWSKNPTYKAGQWQCDVCSIHRSSEVASRSHRTCASVHHWNFQCSQCHRYANHKTKKSYYKNKKGNEKYFKHECCAAMKPHCSNMQERPHKPEVHCPPA